MEVRRVMKLGSSSLVISLPRDWVENFKIKKGDKVICNMTPDGTLVISAKPSKEEEKTAEILISSDYKKGLLARKLIAAYLGNYSIIKIKSESELNSKQQSEVRKTLGKLTGCQIIESSLKGIIIQNLLKIQSFEVNKGIYRAYLITISMFKDMISSLENDRMDLLDGIIEIDEDVDQFYFLILKQLRSVLSDFRMMKRLNLNPIDCLDYFMVMQRVEHVADHIVNISKNLKLLLSTGIKPFVSSYLNNSFKDVYKIYKGSMDSFLLGNVDMANDIINQNDAIRKKKEKLLDKFEDMKYEFNQIAALTSIEDSLFRISDYATDIAEVAINRSL
ncbi:MAG: PhoU domain-containing protein [Candidatus Odinarchaeia archaeon]